MVECAHVECANVGARVVECANVEAVWLGVQLRTWLGVWIGWQGCKCICVLDAQDRLALCNSGVAEHILDSIALGHGHAGVQVLELSTQGITRCWVWVSDTLGRHHKSDSPSDRCIL